jgi:hypothetical protein
MSACTRSHIVVTGTSSGIGRATALRWPATATTSSLPTPVLDGLRCRQAHQPAPGSRMPTPAAQAGVGGRSELSRQRKASPAPWRVAE